MANVGEKLNMLIVLGMLIVLSVLIMLTRLADRRMGISSSHCLFHLFSVFGFRFSVFGFRFSVASHTLSHPLVPSANYSLLISNY